MRRPNVLTLLVAVLFGVFASNLRADITAEQVRQAMDRGIAHLKSKQRSNGSWPDFAVNQIGGVTGLCTLALLNAGVGPEDEHVKLALGWLRKNRLQSTYAVSLQTMVFCKATPSRDRILIDRNVKQLEKTQITDGPGKGAWAYPGRANGDNSNSQFALLALHEAERAGVDVRGHTWRLAKAYWESCQNVDGSWGYRKGNPGTGSMTCAGIASLVIVNNQVHPSDAKLVGERIRCCGAGSVGDNRTERGLQWLERNFSVTRNPGARARLWALYYLYGVERVGRLTARRFIGRHDWYREGADHLVNKEIAGADYWKGVGHAEENDLIATSFALLFLSKGRRPVLLAKLKHAPGNDWNRHRGDVANLTRYVESQWKLDMTWQVIDLGVAKVDDLMQSPVLYYAGSSSPLPTSEAAQKRLARNLRDYLDRGGFLFAEAYCGGKDFDEGFRRLIRRVFPEPEYRLRLLEPEHPIWRAEERVDPDHLRPLWGIEFGCRTSVVYAPPHPPSLSCLWDLSHGVSHGGRREQFPKPVQARIAAARAIGINVLAYATNRELKHKDEIPRSLATSRHDGPAGRGRLAIAALRHPGGCNAAPRALINLLDTAATELKFRAEIPPRQLYLTDDAVFDYHLLFMHGRTAFRLTDAERKRLRTYIDRGGMLFVNSICASQAFSESFRREMAAIFPNRRLERIAATDPVLTPTYGGFDLSTVTRRDPQKTSGTGPLKVAERKVPPVLEGIKLDDRWAVIFSPYDVSCALEKHNSLECQGYVRRDAARIALNVVLYSLQQ